MSRINQLIDILLDSNKPVTISSLSNALKVSNRTISSDLKVVEPICIKYDLNLVKKPRVGVWVEGNLINKDKLRISVENKNQVHGSIYSKDDRITFIMLTLLLRRNKIYIEYFIKNLFVSRSTVEKDLAYINIFFQKYNIEIIKKENNIFYIKGNEISIRNLIIQKLKCLADLNYDFYNVIKENYFSNIQTVYDVINEWCRHYNLMLGKNDIYNLALHIEIMKIRFNTTKELDTISDINLLSCKNKPLIKELRKILENIISYSLPEEEFDYFLLHIIGMTLNTACPLSEEVIYRKLYEQAEMIVEMFLKNIKNFIVLENIELKLKKDLILHLMPTIYRLKSNITLYNPLLNQIKQEYASAFLIASIINTSFYKVLGCNISDEEIAYIAVHLSLIINKDVIKRVAVVCPLGRGVSRLILMKLQQNFPNHEFINCSVKELEDSLDKFDIVISTVNLEIEKPSLVINPLMKNEDIYKIRALIRTYSHNRSKLFSKQTIFILSDINYKEDVIEFISTKMNTYGYVDKEFQTSIMKREEMGSTEVGNGIVLTHGFQESVKKSQIAFVLVKEPIIWNENYVSFIVVLAITKTDSKYIGKLDWLYKMLNDDNEVSLINQCKTENELYDIFINNYRRYE